jgi:hypothetical protein
MANYYDFPTAQAKLAEIKTHSPEFILIPKSMQAMKLPVALSWKQTAFDKANTASVIAQPGIYAFAIQHGAMGLPPHGYIVYVGQAGADKGHKIRTLRQRFTEYFRDKIKPKRPAVHYFLNAWETCLVFHFAPVDPNATDLKAIEAALNDAMLPPFSINDFSAEVRPMKRLSEMF